MATLGEIIKAYREEHHLSMDEFARASGMSKTYVWMLEKNKNTNGGKEVVPTVEYIQKAAKGMFMDFNTLFEMVKGTAKVDTDVKELVAKKALRIPVLGKVAAGTPISAIEEIIGYEEISDELARTGEFFALKIKGNSMEPRIENGSIVIVRQQDDAENGDIVVALVNGDDAVCKKLVKTKSGISLVSINPSYDPLFFSNVEINEIPVRIIGKVVEFRTKCE